jgi:hypothetical protein
VAVAAIAVIVIALLLPQTAGAVAPTFVQGFETDTAGWSPIVGDTITRQPSGYTNSGGYASGITSAAGAFHARLGRGECDTITGGIGDAVQCAGAFTRWGGSNSVWQGGYTTQVDVYLDVPYAVANSDSTSGNIGCLTASNPSTDPACRGTWFSFASAINDNTGTFLRDFAFVAATVLPGAAFPCTGWTVVASTNTTRIGVDVHSPANDPVCVTTSGWYTLEHTFFDNGGVLDVRLDLVPAGSATAIKTWTLTAGDLIANVGCNRYGWFVDQEIMDLAIDRSSMTGCGTPPAPTLPTSPEQCKKGGWQEFGVFKNQGDCINSVVGGATTRGPRTR